MKPVVPRSEAPVDWAILLAMAIGGGVYQPALQYGGGLKFRVAPRLTMRADFGETWSANPKLVKDSYKGYIPTGLDNSYSTFIGYVSTQFKYVQQHSTAGFAFTF